MPALFSAAAVHAAQLSLDVAMTFTVDGHTIHFFAPPGYCMATRDDFAGKGVYESQDALDEGEYQIIGVYFDCDEWIEAWTGRRRDLPHVGMIKLAKVNGHVDVDIDRTRRDEIDRALRYVPATDLASVNQEIREQSKKVGIPPTELKSRRLVQHDDLAAYVVEEWAPKEGDRPVMSVTAISKTNGLPFINVMTAPAGEPNVLDRLLTGQQKFMAALIARNESPDQQRAQAIASPTFADRLARYLARHSDLEIGVLCFLGAVMLLLRIRRA